MEKRQGESRPYSLGELTEAERREVNFRGWPVGGGYRYIAKVQKPGAVEGWLLVRWTREAS